MKVLMVESQLGIADKLSTVLAEAGHQVLSCADEITDGPCRSVDNPGECPLHQRVDIAVVVRPEGSPDTLLEMGAVCAERHRIPVVHVDPSTTGDVGRLVHNALAAGRDRIEAAYAAAVRAALASDQASVEVGGDSSRIWVRVGLPASGDHGPVWSIADRARTAIRGYDPFVRSIDVSIGFDR
jgi:hypothetical protein